MSLPVYRYGIPPQLSYRHPHPSLGPQAEPRTYSSTYFARISFHCLYSSISPHTSTPLSLHLKDKTHPTIDFIPNPVSRLIEQSTNQKKITLAFHHTATMSTREAGGGGQSKHLKSKSTRENTSDKDVVSAEDCVVD